MVGGLRRVRLRSNNKPNDPGRLFNGVYVVSGPIDALPTNDPDAAQHDLGVLIGSICGIGGESSDGGYYVLWVSLVVVCSYVS